MRESKAQPVKWRGWQGPARAGHCVRMARAGKGWALRENGSVPLRVSSAWHMAYVELMPSRRVVPRVGVVRRLAEVGIKHVGMELRERRLVLRATQLEFQYGSHPIALSLVMI